MVFLASVYIRHPRLVALGYQPQRQEPTVTATHGLSQSSMARWPIAAAECAAPTCRTWKALHIILLALGAEGRNLKLIINKRGKCIITPITLTAKPVLHIPPHWQFQAPCAKSRAYRSRWKSEPVPEMEKTVGKRKTLAMRGSGLRSPLQQCLGNPSWISIRILLYFIYFLIFLTGRLTQMRFNSWKYLDGDVAVPNWESSC